jgi:alpha-ketoglutarate-dependent taurine dioxygenase
LTIFSDGRVFADIVNLTISDCDAYVARMKEQTSSMNHLSWDNLDPYVTMMGPKSCGNLVEKYGLDAAVVNGRLQRDPKYLRQYTGLVRFMLQDRTNRSLPGRKEKRECRRIAREMLLRNEALSRLLRDVYPNHFRLSIHQHPYDGQKFSIRLCSFIRGQLRTPWHNALLVQDDEQESKALVPKAQIEAMPRIIEVKNNGGTWCYLQSSRDLPIPLDVSMIQPRFGAIVKNPLGTPVAASTVPVSILRALANQFGFVVLKGFQTMDESGLRSYCSSFGELVHWNFGPLHAVKPLPHSEGFVDSEEGLPLHWDVSYPPEYLVKSGHYEDYVPRYFMFQCMHAPATGRGGETTFLHGRLLLENATAEELQQWRRTVITTYTKKTYLGGRKFDYPMIMTHPVTGEEILRYPEPWSSPLQSIVNRCASMDTTSFEKLTQTMQDRLYDRRWYMEYAWEDGDIALVENHLILHGRRPLRVDTRQERDPRELWRIQMY